MLHPGKIAVQGVGSQPLLMALQGLVAQGAGPQPPSPGVGGLVYSPLRSPIRSPVRDVARWSA